jgi:hypothetical protein
MQNFEANKKRSCKKAQQSASGLSSIHKVVLECLAVDHRKKIRKQNMECLAAAFGCDSIDARDRQILIKFT